MFSKNIFYFVLFILTLFLWVNPAAAKDDDRRASLALLPLEQSAGKDISQLRQGLKSMLLGRLAKRAEIKIICVSPTSQQAKSSSEAWEKEVQKLINEYNTDYLLAGRLIERQEHFVVETMIYAKGANKALQTFSQKFTNDKMLDAVDAMSWDIAEKIFGSHRPAPRPKNIVAAQATPTPPPMSAPTQPSEPLVPSFQSSHPDRTLKKEIITGELPELPPIKPYISFVLPSQTAPAQVTAQALKKETGTEEIPVPVETGPTDLPQTRTKGKIDMAMHNMDIGDLDGDGRVDVVISDNNELAAYHLGSVNLREFAGPAPKAPGRIISIRLADINQNGRDEIYVSCIVEDTGESFAIEWNGEKFTYLFKNEKWLVSPLYIPGEGIILAGQRSGENELFVPGIFRLQFISQVVQQREEVMADNLSLYNFALADLDADGKNEIITLEQNHTLVVKNDTGLLWQSSETFCDAITIAVNNGKSIEIPARILIADINNDQLPDVIIKENVAADSGDIDEPDDFIRGSIQVFSWNGSELNKIWQSEAVAGYISGYRYFPADGTHTAQLYTGVVPQASLFDFFSRQDSLILIYPVIFE